MTTKKITRRTFLGTTAVGAASSSLSLNTWAQAVNNQKSPLINGTIPALEDDVKVVNTYHEIHCHGQCMLKAHVKDGKLLALTSAGDIPSKDCLPSDESIGKMQRRACMKGYAERKRLYAPDRLKYPLIQTIERGNTAGFKRVSWDEALDRAQNAGSPKRSRLPADLEQWLCSVKYAGTMPFCLRPPFSRQPKRLPL